MSENNIPEGTQKALSSLDLRRNLPTGKVALLFVIIGVACMFINMFLGGLILFFAFLIALGGLRKHEDVTANSAALAVSFVPAVLFAGFLMLMIFLNMMFGSSL